MSEKQDMGSMDRTQQRAAMMAAAGAVRDFDASMRRLAGWLEGRLGADVAVSNMRVPTGAGLANETLLFDAAYTEGGQRRSTSLVARVKPYAVVLFPDPDFDGLVRLFQTLGETGHVKVPKVYWLEQDPSILGAPFFIMEMLKARTPVSQPPYTAAGWLFEATPGELVSFIGWPKYGPTGEDQQLGYWEDYGRWVGLPMPDEILALGEWVRKNRPNDPGIHLSWGDARIGNMMFGDDFRLAAVLDWDQMCLADPRHDLAWWLYFDRMYTEGMGIQRPAGMGDGKDTVALWQDLTGLKAGDLSWYEAYLVYKLSMISMKTFAAAGQPAEAAAKHGKSMIERLRAQLDIG